MNCEEIQDFLYDYTKNEATVKEISAIEVHLKSCQECASELAHIKGICSLIKASMEEPHGSVLLNISRSIRPAVKKTLGWFKPALAAAMVLMAGTAVLLYNRPYKAEIAEIPDEIMAGYTVVSGDYYDELNEKGHAVEMASAGAGAYARSAKEESEDGYTSGSSYYNSGYTPVNYILGQ